MKDLTGKYIYIGKDTYNFIYGKVYIVVDYDLLGNYFVEGNKNYEWKEPSIFKRFNEDLDIKLTILGIK